MHALFCTLGSEKYSRVSLCTNAKEFWDKSEVIHDGTNQVKISKVGIFTLNYETFLIKLNEDIKAISNRFTIIIMSSNPMGKPSLKKEGLKIESTQEKDLIIFYEYSFDNEDIEVANPCLMAIDDSKNMSTIGENDDDLKKISSSAELSKEPEKAKIVMKTPTTGFVKINVDAAVLHGCSGFDAIARDQDGFVLGGCYKFAEKSMEVTWVELEAFTEGLKLATQLNMARLILESDNVRLVNAINKRMEDITILGQRINQECIVFNSFSSIKINWIGRKSNIVADELSNLAIKNRADLYFEMEYPLDIHNNIINDAIR
ncbi:hypothetical protein J1N35_014215 [Gossypium stocksii]|uniref:RNase H type-1 domain-containing protein n=1 Tax=Gossypium stocksii TaxID=47602 RepID=A0A9D4A937_9ROSI|nr:hypothetical protein J1N35_014215 [Gossypium stocksii]